MIRALVVATAAALLAAPTATAATGTLTGTLGIQPDWSSVTDHGQTLCPCGPTPRASGAGCRCGNAPKSGPSAASATRHTKPAAMCGTNAGAMRHYRNGETPCSPCLLRLAVSTPADDILDAINAPDLDLAIDAAEDAAKDGGGCQ